MSLTITIPAPCEWINSNMRLHRMAQANLTKQWRLATYKAFIGIAPITTPVHITAHIWKARGGRYDVGNLYPTIKACVDGIVDAGVLVDDSNEYVTGPDLRHGGKGEPRIVFTIQTITPDILSDRT